MSAMLAPQLFPHPMRGTTLDRVIAIEQDIYEFPWTIGNFRDALAADYACWEYWNELDLVGYAIVMSAPDEVHLLNLSVARALQGRGYGGRMLAHLLDAARGVERMLLEVRPSNEVARKLYEREGFVEIGRRRGYYPALNGREDAIILAKTL
jgi:[ribosomal protein S18]-alanine N-acetyltransferase